MIPSSSRLLPVVLTLVLLPVASPSMVGGTPVPVGGQFQVNSYTTSVQEEPALAADAVCNFLVMWESGAHSARRRAG